MVEEQRAAVVAEACSSIGTPYRLGAESKVPAAIVQRFIAQVLIACRLAKREDLGGLFEDWFFHDQTKTCICLRLLRHTTKTLEAVAFRSFAATPGDVVLTRTHSSKERQSRRGRDCLAAALSRDRLPKWKRSTPLPIRCGPAGT